MAEARPFDCSLPDALRHADPRVLDFLKAWAGARHGRVVPLRRSFDPILLPALMPSISLYRFEASIGDFVCRLAGETVNAAWGESIKGMTLAQIVGPTDHPVILGRWQRMLSAPHIHYGFGRERLSRQQVHRAERLLLPLCEDAPPHEPSYVLALSLYKLSALEPGRPALAPEDSVQVPCEELPAIAPGPAFD